MSETASKARVHRQGRRRTLAALPSPAPASAEELAATRGLARLRLDLHDGPLQDLAAVGLAFGALHRELESLPVDTSAVAQELAEIQGVLGEVEHALRSVANGGRGEVGSAGILELVGAEVTRFEQRYDMPVQVDVAGDVEPATDSQRIALQRVLREALTNVGRHAQATEARVELFGSDDVVYLRVRDNGLGCVTASAGTNPNGRSKLGLAGMRERLELLGGSLSFASQPGGPTTVTAALRRWRPAAVGSRAEA